MSRRSIGELTEAVITWNPAKSPDLAFKYVDLSSVASQTKRVAKAAQIMGVVAPSRARQLIAVGDILVSTVRPNLNAVAVVPDELDGATASTGFTVLRPGPKLDGRYLFHWVRSDDFIADMVRKATGASYPAVSDRIVKESTLPVPSIEEQRRIAAILDHADALRAKRRQVLTHLDALTQSIFYDMSHSGWSTALLGESLTFITSGGRGWAKYLASNGSRFVQSLDVQMDRVSDRDPVFVTPPLGAEADRTRIHDGDVLLTITGSRIGRVAMVPPGLAGGYVSQHVAILRPDVSRFLPRFLAVLLSLPRLGQRLISRAQYGQTKPGLNFQQIRAFELPLPTIDEQRAFLARVGSVDELREQHQAAAGMDDELFASLRSRAFKGEL